MSNNINTIISQLPPNQAWSALDPEASKYLIPTAELLKAVIEDDDIEVIDGVYDFDEMFNKIKQLTGITSDDDLKAGNTSNWCARISHDVDYRYAYDCDGNFYIALRLHFASGYDIRCGYTDWVILKAPSYEAFGEVILQSQYHYSFDIECDGKNYSITPLVFSEYYEVWCDDDSWWYDGLYPDDLQDEDCRNAIREARK